MQNPSQCLPDVWRIATQYQRFSGLCMQLVWRKISFLISVMDRKILLQKFSLAPFHIEYAYDYSINCLHMKQKRIFFFLIFSHFIKNHFATRTVSFPNLRERYTVFRSQYRDGINLFSTNPGKDGTPVGSQSATGYDGRKYSFCIIRLPATLGVLTV